MNNDYLIEAKDVRVKYGRIFGLEHFTADIPKGIIGLLGPNGAGKSTFIKSLLGLVERDHGSIKIKGFDPESNMTKIRDMIGYMPEHECLIDQMNSVELVSYMAQISGLRGNRAKQRTHETLDFVGLGEERYREISSYSTGMKQRVKLAQSIVHDPEILFLDEPTNGMDPEGREEMLSLIQKIGKSGKTIIVCSHILNEVEKVSEYIFIINDGRKLLEGPIDSLIKGNEGRYRVKIRGEIENLQDFTEKLEEKYDVSSKQYEGGQVEFIVDGVKDNDYIFQLAESNDVQLRSIRRHKLTLEDVFIDAFERGDLYGD
ncbi:MAG: ABC transporter ATP-binding protein [Thermoplasmatota archaeon]